MPILSNHSVSIDIEPDDTRCRYWAKRIDAATVLALPPEVNGAKDIPGAFLSQGEDELAVGDFLIEGEQVHHRHPERGWTYRIGYMGIDGALQGVTPTKEHKAALKTAGMPVEYLKGAGELAACVRIIHGLRMGLHAGVVPIETSAVPVSMDDYARTAQLHEVWFQPTATEAEPAPWRVYQQAAALARTSGNLQNEHQELPVLDALACG
jgi:hypothetical protein